MKLSVLDHARNLAMEENRPIAIVPYDDNFCLAEVVNHTDCIWVYPNGKIHWPDPSVGGSIQEQAATTIWDIELDGEIPE
jgi:hypothetical protein